MEKLLFNEVQIHVVVKVHLRSEQSVFEDQIDCCGRHRGYPYDCVTFILSNKKMYCSSAWGVYNSIEDISWKKAVLCNITNFFQVDRFLILT